MRSINKSDAIQPENTKRVNDKFVAKTNKVIQQRNLEAKNRQFTGYADDATKRVLAELYAGGNVEMDENGAEVFNPKCAYCESTSVVVASLQVEHYRPKKEITNEPTHKGYYWLAFEWTNLIYACPKCNGQGAKGNRFPILGARATQEPKNIDGTIHYDAFDANHQVLRQELPLLLHPEIDNPPEHLTFRPSGQISGLTERGSITIDICKLNRTLLIKARKEIMDDLRKKLKLIILAFVSMNQQTEITVKMELRTIFDEITIDRQAPSATYTLLGRCINMDFDNFILNDIDQSYRQALRNAFDMYLRHEL